jgi:sulfoxide reductase catalytic subunit YedY
MSLQKGPGVARRGGQHLREELVTPESVFLSRRALLARGAQLGLGATGIAAAGSLAAAGAPARRGRAAESLPLGGAGARYPARRNEEASVRLEPTPADVAASYNNFYEFGPGKDIAGRAARLTTHPWTLEIGGLVERPAELDVERLTRLFELEERVYRFRCVEAWAMVVPWTGFPLARLLEWAGPRPEARFVRFESFQRPSEALGQLVSFWHPWPYTEGLSVEEARHDLVLLATGVYGKPLPKQHGAPIRLVVPWKYGFKSIKSVVRIELVRERPRTFWNEIEPAEYDFHANVNPFVPHPRWSQATERLLGSDVRQPTLLYNGYAREVAALYG